MIHKPPQAPSHLRPATQAWFTAVLTDFELEQHHIRLLTLAAESWDRCTQAREILDRDGLTFTDRFGQPKSRPENGIERDSKISFSRLLRELALDVSEPGDSRPPIIPANGSARRFA